jgi:hypothetical protein
MVSRTLCSPCNEKKLGSTGMIVSFEAVSALKVSRPMLGGQSTMT